MSQNENSRHDISDLRVELFEALDDKVNEKFDRAKELLSLTIGAALKVLAGVIVLLLTIITLLGVKTAGDISDSIRQVTTEQITKRLKDHDPAAEFQERVDALYDQALVNSYLLTVQRRKNERFYRETIESEDVDRLLDILRRPQSELHLFRDAAIILRKLSDSTSWRSIAREYVDLVDASKTEYSFMRAERERREILITQLAEKEYKDAKKSMKGIIADKDQSEKLRVVAIEYLAEIGDFTAIQDLESLTQSTVPDIQKAAFGAVARLNPKSSNLSSWVDNFRKISPGNPEDIQYGFVMVSKLMEGNPKYLGFFGDHDPDEEHRLETSKLILKSIFSNDIGFFSNTRGVERDRTLTIAIGDDPGVFYHVDTDTLFGKGFIPIRSLLRDYSRSNQVEELSQLVKKISVRDGDHVVAIVRVNLSGEAKIVTHDGLVLDKKEAPMGVGLSWNSIDKSLEVVWLDSSASRMRRKMASIESADGIQFRLETDVDFDGVK